MPRPYDCVRRAWHTETHQPIRGTLIQEIFRVANETHGSVTKNNKEYQEKLPIVVLKVEEILYSKANSVEEYMDLTTLLDRINDAIDTIIRRDRHTEESGEYLRPCIEAALSLGCSLTKPSRSQRNSPRCYLSRTTEQVPNVSHANGKDHLTKFQFVSYNVPSASKKQCLEHQQPTNLFSVYPLYHLDNIQFNRSQQQGFEVSHDSVSHASGHAVVGGAQNLLAHNNGDPQNPYSHKCDLSLRLGPLTLPSSSFGNDRVHSDLHEG